MNALAREKARERMLALPESEKAARARAMQEGRRRARERRPERLREVEARMDALGVEYRSADSFSARHAIRCELRDLGRERMSLRYGSES